MTVDIGVSGPGVVDSALKRRIAAARESGSKLTLTDLAEEIKISSFRVTRVGELIGREVAELFDIPLGSSTFRWPRPRRSATVSAKSSKRWDSGVSARPVPPRRSRCLTMPSKKAGFSPRVRSAD